MRGFPFKRAGKFNAKRTEYAGRTYSSKKEAAYAQRLDVEKATGDVLMWLSQVPFTLKSGVRYVVDFAVWRSDGFCYFVDVKGFRTETYKLKKRLVEAEFPVTIVEV